MPTQLEYNLAKSQVRLTRVKMILLNYNFQKVGELTGDLTEMPSFTINADSDIRRTCSVTLTPRDSSFDIKKGNKIWLDKYIKIFVEQKDVYGNVAETNMGIYLINNPQRVYSATQNTLSFQGVDLMAKLTGMRNGNLKGLPYLVPQGSNVRLAILSVLDMCGFTDCVVEECTVDVPNDIEIKLGGTAYDVLKALRDIMPNYQMYFDRDGVFHYDKIPTGKNEQIKVDDDIWKYNLIDYQKTNNFENLKNSIEVFGKTHTIKNYGDKAEISGDTYKITINNVTSVRRNTKIGFNTDTDVGEKKYLEVTTKKNNVDSKTGLVTVQTTKTKCPIQSQKGVVPTFKNEDTYYVVNYTYPIDQWEFVKTQDVKNPKVAVISNNETYIVSDSSITKYNNGMEYTFRTPTKGCETVYTPYFQINNLKKIPIYNTVKLRNDTTYTIQYKEADTDEAIFEFMGEVTPYAQIKEENPQSPFYVGGTIGEINIVLSGGEYDNIYTSDLAYERAKWELYNRCRLQDSVSINCIPIYWLDVNWLISITLPNKFGEEETNLYIVKNINIANGVGGTMSVTLMQYYPYYDEED